MILTFLESGCCTSYGVPAGIALPQYGHVPDVTPTFAATGIPQVGHSPTSIDRP